MQYDGNVLCRGGVPPSPCSRKLFQVVEEESKPCKYTRTILEDGWAFATNGGINLWLSANVDGVASKVAEVKSAAITADVWA
eukprot:CAMPEP_0118652758 /NCGR_PEP_ID=MMETSP0785-20121206/11481_1 /TAXON_ID=91992 /ORGANISM="Bolidomonas pacifica, Strain CCMP 1866" /LENGTH=81 /DNA_ID=CAMNT_0006545281 /DNA_START=86 /DNA_END=328 /DNA_ORIENTATION=+